MFQQQHIHGTAQFDAVLYNCSVSCYVTLLSAAILRVTLSAIRTCFLPTTNPRVIMLLPHVITPCAVLDLVVWFCVFRTSLA
jgi:hypothetical protein